jgi:hypothetical protein
MRGGHHSKRCKACAPRTYARPGWQPGTASSFPYELVAKRFHPWCICARYFLCVKLMLLRPSRATCAPRSAIPLPPTDYPLFDALPPELITGGKLSQLQVRRFCWAACRPLAAAAAAPEPHGHAVESPIAGMRGTQHGPSAQHGQSATSSRLPKLIMKRRAEAA